MIGLKFKIFNEYNNFIEKILEGINIENYNLNITDSEVLDVKTNDILDKSFYTGLEFANIIKNKEYYSIFLNAKAFPKNTNIQAINNYKDFINSECEFVLIIIDNIFVDFYTKSQFILNKVKDNIKKYNFIDMEIIKGNKLEHNFNNL